jgi:hypothetical protein
MARFSICTPVWPLLASLASGAMAAQPVLTYTDGGYYQGGLVDGKREGEGAYLYPDYSLYLGQWQAGVKQGQGLFKWPNGNIYEGGWQDGVPHGEGTLTFADGGVFRGRWVQGQPVEDPADTAAAEPSPAEARAERCRQVEKIQAALRGFAGELQARAAADPGGEGEPAQTWGIDLPCP